MERTLFLPLILVALGFVGCNTRDYPTFHSSDTTAPSSIAAVGQPPHATEPPPRLTPEDSILKGQLIPLAVGNRWSYRDISGGPAWFEFLQQEIIAAREMPYFEYAVSGQYDPTCQCYKVSESIRQLGTSVWYFANNFRQGGGLLYSPIKEGIRLGILLRRTGRDASEDSVEFYGFIPKVPVTGTSFRGGKWEGRKWITTTAGRFNCYVWKNLSSVKYFAPDVGLVRAEENGNGTNVVELTSYSVR
jgi:hypothetical protein